MIFALDIATVTGFCFGPVGAHPPLLQWGMRDFSRKEASNGEVVALFRGWFAQRCYYLKPTLVLFESPYIPTGDKPGGGARMNPFVLRRLLGMTGAVEAVCWELQIECRESVSAAFTKYVTGKGQYKSRDEKKAAVIAACRWYGIEVGTDDNQADAAALWLYAEGLLSPRAADARRRFRADRDRELNGAGPLFSTIEKKSAPQAGSLRGADDQLNPGKVEWSKTEPVTA
jgi:hypothetical protein